MPPVHHKMSVTVQPAGSGAPATMTFPVPSASLNLKWYSGAAGPKVSSLVMTMSVVTLVKTVGSKRVPPWAAACRR